MLDHPYAPCHPPSAPPMGEGQGVNSQTAGIGCVVMINIFYFSVIVGIVCHMSSMSGLVGKPKPLSCAFFDGISNSLRTRAHVLSDLVVL